MAEFVVISVAVLLLFGLAKKYIILQNEKMQIWVDNQRVEFQDELKQLDNFIEETKKTNGKWYTIDDIENKMK